MRLQARDEAAGVKCKERRAKREEQGEDFNCKYHATNSLNVVLLDDECLENSCRALSLKTCRLVSRLLLSDLFAHVNWYELGQSGNRISEIVEPAEMRRICTFSFASLLPL